MRVCREGKVGSESQNCFVACVQSLHDRVVSARHHIKVFLRTLEYHQFSPIFRDKDTGCSRGHVDDQTSDCRKCIGVVLEVWTKIWSSGNKIHAWLNLLGRSWLCGQFPHRQVSCLSQTQGARDSIGTRPQDVASASREPLEPKGPVWQSFKVTQTRKTTNLPSHDEDSK